MPNGSVVVFGIQHTKHNAHNVHYEQCNPNFNTNPNHYMPIPSLTLTWPQFASYNCTWLSCTVPADWLGMAATLKLLNKQGELKTSSCYNAIFCKHIPFRNGFSNITKSQRLWVESKFPGSQSILSILGFSITMDRPEAPPQLAKDPKDSLLMS